MFENLSDRLQDIAHKIKGYGKITEENIAPMMREIRLSLLEADVNLRVVKSFISNIKDKAVGIKRTIDFLNLIEKETLGHYLPIFFNG